METEPKIIEAYIATGKAKLIYRHLLQLGEGTTRTAEASECAADQGKFWEMRNLLYERQSDLYATNNLEGALIVFARELSLDEDPFNSCMSSRKHLEAVRADYLDAQAAGVRSRPTIDINGVRIVGAQPFEVFQRTIDKALAP